jgi:hypothetical protein
VVDFSSWLVPATDGYGALRNKTHTTATPSSGTAFKVGRTFVHVEAKDNAGNSADCFFAVIVTSDNGTSAESDDADDGDGMVRPGTEDGSSGVVNGSVGADDMASTTLSSATDSTTAAAAAAASDAAAKSNAGVVGGVVAAGLVLILVVLAAVLIMRNQQAAVDYTAHSLPKTTTVNQAYAPDNGTRSAADEYSAAAAVIALAAAPNSATTEEPAAEDATPVASSALLESVVDSEDELEC